MSTRSAPYTEVKALLVKGDFIIVTMPREELAGAQTTYCLGRAGHRITTATFQKIKGDLQPRDPGLFSEGPATSYELKPGKGALQ